MFKIKKAFLWILSIIVVIGCILGFIGYRQSQHFNKNISINGINVGNMTAQQATDKLKSSKQHNTVYIDNKPIYKGKDISVGFTDADKGRVSKILKEQYTFLPSSKSRGFNLSTNQVNKYRQVELKKIVKSILENKNKNLTASKDAIAILTNGKVEVKSAVQGSKYDIVAMMKQYARKANDDKINLSKITTKPLTADSQEIQTQKEKLNDLVGKSVNYDVNGTNYNISAKEVLNNVTYQNGKYHIGDLSLIKQKIKEINEKSGTLDKSYQFKTHSGSVITVQNKTYGWDIYYDSALKTLISAFENNQTQVNAKDDIYGVGYLTYGLGYGKSNNGLGNTYAEVSIAEQHAWFYRDGQLVDDVDIVTGNHADGQDTPTGVYYIMYKQSPSTLKGVHPAGDSYSVKVNYWAQFTSDGCGFHDASWRNNWSKTAYLTDGSNGCCNIAPSNMKKVYDSLEQKEPVIIY